jgi:osmotically inducible protein OsmC
MAIRNAEAAWFGSLREGAGELALESGAFRGPYTFRARFEEGKETNPEELLGSAGFSIPRIELKTRANIPGMNATHFAELAADAKRNCPVSKALAGVDITLDAALV